MDVLAEEMEEDIGVDLSVGVRFQKYEEPESSGSGDCLLGEEIEGEQQGREEVVGDALMAAETDFSFDFNGTNVETDLYFNANDINKCHCPPPIVESTTAVDDANIGTDFVVIPDDVYAPTAALTLLS